MIKVKDLTQRLAAQEHWKARNNLKTFLCNSEEARNVIKFFIPSKGERRFTTEMFDQGKRSKEYDWRKANWQDPDDYNAKDLK